MNHIWKVLEFDLVHDSWRFFFFAQNHKLIFFYDILLPVLFHIITWARRSAIAAITWGFGFDLVCKTRMEELQCECVCVCVREI